MTPGVCSLRRHHSSNHRRHFPQCNQHQCSSLHPCCARWRPPHHHNSTAFLRRGGRAAAARSPLEPSYRAPWYTGNTLPARAAIVHNTLTPVPAVLAEDVAQFPPDNYCAGRTVVREHLHAAGDRVRAGLPRHGTQAHRLRPHDPGPQHLQKGPDRGTSAHHAPAGPDHRSNGARHARLCLGPHHRGLATGGLHQPGDLLPRPQRLHVPRGASSEVYTGETISRALPPGIHRRGPGLCLLHAADGVAQQVPPRLGTGGRLQWLEHTGAAACERP